MFLYVVLVLVVFRLFVWYKHFRWIGGIKEKCVFITGCDSGFGNAAAKSLQGRGVPVFAGCLTEDGARRLREETSGGVRTVILDVTSTESIKAAYKYVLDNLPHRTELWGVVNNAGIIGNLGPVEFSKRTDYLKALEVNCLGPIDVVLAFLPALKKSRGRIVNTASIAAEAAIPGFPPYSTSKFAVRGFTEALRRDKAQWGISVSLIEPGGFKTAMTSNLSAQIKDQQNNMDDDIRKEYGDNYLETSLMSGSKMSTLPDLTPVVSAYEHALFSKHPRAKYAPGKGNIVFLFVAYYCPTFVMDSMLKAALPRILPAILQVDKKNM